MTPGSILEPAQSTLLGAVALAVDRVNDGSCQASGVAC